MKKIVGLLFVLSFLQSCVSKKQILYMQDADAYNQSQVQFGSNTLQPNDIVKITVGALVPETALPYNMVTSNTVQANNLDVMKLEGYLVSAEHTLNFPILGVLPVKDKTPADLEKDLVQRLESGGHLVNPSVSVRLLNAKVTVLGEVNHPGTYTFTENNISLLQALGLAGDLTINGKRDDVVLIREVNEVRTVAHIDLTASNWLTGPYNQIKPNDVLVVNPNNTKVKSAGFIGNAATVLSIVSILLSTAILLTR